MHNGFRNALIACVALATGIAPGLAQRLDSRVDNNKQDMAACHGEDPDKAISGCTNLLRGTGDTVGASSTDGTGPSTVVSTIATNPVIADATIARAFNYLKKKNFDGAISDCTRVIRLLPNHPVCYNIRAAAFVSKNLDDNALADVERGVALAPNNADLLATRGQVYEKIGATEEAIADYRKALQINPNQPSAREGLVRLRAP